MKSGKRDSAEGKMHQVKGRVRELVGKMVGNPDLAADGKAEKAYGRVQQKRGQAKKSISK